MNDYLMGRTCEFLSEFNSRSARSTPGAKHFDTTFLLHRLDFLSVFLYISRLRGYCPVHQGWGMHSVNLRHYIALLPLPEPVSFARGLQFYAPHQQSLL